MEAQSLPQIDRLEGVGTDERLPGAHAPVRSAGVQNQSDTYA